MSILQPKWASDDEDDPSLEALPPKRVRSKPAKHAVVKHGDNVPLNLAWILLIVLGAGMALTGLGFGVRHFYLQARESNRIAKAEVDRKEAEAAEMVQAAAAKLEAEKEADRVGKDEARIAEANVQRQNALRIEEERVARQTADAEAEKLAAETKRTAMVEGQKERKSRLAELELQNTARLKEFNDRIKVDEQGCNELQGQIDKISKAAARYPKVNAKAMELVAELKSATTRLNSLTAERDAFVDQAEQTRRGIMATFPIPDELPFTNLQGRWLTESEYAAVVERQKAIERRQIVRANGARLANWVWQFLSADYEFDVKAKDVVLISETSGRFVDPQIPSAYSLAPNENKPMIRQFFRNTSLDDSFAFEVTYVNGLGQAIRKFGYVEIGYDQSGAAGLLGVSVPFLNNPLNGHLVAVRGGFDKAMGRAYGIPGGSTFKPDPIPPVTLPAFGVPGGSTFNPIN